MPLIAWNIKSTTKAQDGFYVYDTVQRLYDGQFGDGDVSDIAHYIRLGKLGEAFTSTRRCVLLIDEIDKADIEFPNDLLWELDQMEFYIPETHETIKADPAAGRDHHLQRRKGVARRVPAPLRLPFHRVPRRGHDGAHRPGAPSALDERLLELALQAFYWLRGVAGLQKKPSTSELIDWVQALQVGGVPHDDIAAALPFIGVLLKKDHDVDVAVDALRAGRGRR